MSEIRQLLELGNHYADHYQWDNSGLSFESALAVLYLDVGTELRLDIEPRLHDTLVKAEDQTIPLEGDLSALEASALVRLRDQIENESAAEGLHLTRFVSIFRSPARG